MKLRLLFPLFLFPYAAVAQRTDTVSLQQCYALAEKHYPLLQQDSLLREKLELAVRNLNTRYLPQLSVNGQATYQSDVVSFPFKLPGMETPVIPKDQYRVTLDLQQLIYDGGRLKQQKSLEETADALRRQQQNITLHQVREQLNNWYASALLSEAGGRALQLQEQDLLQRMKKTATAIRNGAALPSQADELQVALLQAQQQGQELQANRHALLAALSLFTGSVLSDSVTLVLPEDVAIDTSAAIRRPELLQFQWRRQSLEQQAALVRAGALPAVSAFVQGGYGRPGLNMLSDEADAFYLAGVRLRWDLWDWHYHRRKTASLHLDMQQLQLQKETFLLQTGATLRQAGSDIRQLEQSLEKDRQIVALQENILRTAATRLDQGTLTPTDYLLQLNAGTAARIRQQTHLIQLRFAKIRYQLLKSE